MNRTKIEWCKNPDGTQGYTWNPITGCLNGCSYCYARKLANGRLKSRMLANYDIAKKGYSMVAGKPCTLAGLGFLFEKEFADPFYPRLWPDRVTEILRGHQHQSWHKYPGRGIFVCSMGDLFGQGVPKLWTHQVLDTIRIMQGGNQHWYPTDDRFYLLTKQPQNLGYWSPFPDNCWVGASVTNAQEQSDAYVGLGRIEATVKYLSYEPLLSNVVMEPQFLKDAGINWLIIGAQTKPTVMPKVEWVREIVEAADAADIPVFLKDSLKPLFAEVEEPGWLVGWENCPGELRQEFPKGV